jgi:hypothetical protein
MYAICSRRWGLRRPTLQFFVSVPFSGCEISKLFLHTQIAYNENIMDQCPNRTAGSLTLWQGSCFLIYKKVTNLNKIGEINNMNKLKYIAAVLIAIAGFGLQQAKADQFVSSLNHGNTGPTGISGFPGPYGTVLVTLTSSTTATITFTSSTNSGNIYLFGDGGSVAVNLNASTFTVDSITGSNSGTGFTPGPYTFAGAGVEDGFGSFNLTINSFDGFTHSSDSITFTVTNTSGTWGSAADVLIANAGGFDAAAHIFVTASPANAANGAISTGFAAETGGHVVVPDGGTTVMLLGAALGVLGMARRFLMG